MKISAEERKEYKKAYAHAYYIAHKDEKKKRDAEYRQKNPELYRGHVGDISMVLRIAVSGKTKSPDLYSIMQILGKDRVIKRLNAAK